MSFYLSNIFKQAQNAVGCFFRLGISRWSRCSHRCSDAMMMEVTTTTSIPFDRLWENRGANSRWAELAELVDLHEENSLDDRSFLKAPRQGFLGFYTCWFQVLLVRSIWFGGCKTHFPPNVMAIYSPQRSSNEGVSESLEGLIWHFKWPSNTDIQYVKSILGRRQINWRELYYPFTTGIISNHIDPTDVDPEKWASEGNSLRFSGSILRWLSHLFVIFLAASNPNSSYSSSAFQVFTCF